MQLQEAVTTAHETSTAFSEQVLREHAYFEMDKQAEMKDMLQSYADGQVEMLKRAMDDWDRVSTCNCLMCGESRFRLTRTDYPRVGEDSGGCVTPTALSGPTVGLLACCMLGFGGICHLPSARMGMVNAGTGCMDV